MHSVRYVDVLKFNHFVFSSVLVQLVPVFLSTSLIFDSINSKIFIQICVNSCVECFFLLTPRLLSTLPASKLSIFELAGRLLMMRSLHICLNAAVVATTAGWLQTGKGLYENCLSSHCYLTVNL